MKSRILLIFTILSIFSISCNKEAEFESPEVVQEKSVTYFLDGQEISEAFFYANYESYQNVIEVKKDAETDGEIVIANSFSSDQKYIDWGAENGYDFALRLEVIEHLKNYAEENGIIARYEETNELPKSYLDYEAEYLRTSGLLPAVDERTLGHVYNYCSIYTQNLPFFSTMPVMPSG